MCIINARLVNVHIIVQIYCYSKCGIGLQGFNPHLPFGNHLLGNFFCFFLDEEKGFLHFPFLRL